MGVVDAKQDDPGKPGPLWRAFFGALSHPVGALVFAALFMAVGAGVFAYLGFGRAYVPRKPGDLAHAARMTAGVFAMCLIMGGISLAVRRRRK